MKIIHIIPAAFHYFDDIRDGAMALAEKQRELGHEVVAYTLQYGTVTSGQNKQIGRLAPLLNFGGVYRGETVVNELNDFDVVHLHAPFLGLAGKILAWKNLNSKKRLVITYWRYILPVDLFSYFIVFYNRYYLRRLFAAADAIICSSAETFAKTRGWRLCGNLPTLVDLGEAVNELERSGVHLTLPADKLKLTNADMEALACVSIYNNLINL
jgi:hypothetical protein